MKKYIYFTFLLFMGPYETAQSDTVCNFGKTQIKIHHDSTNIYLEVADKGGEPIVDKTNFVSIRYAKKIQLTLPRRSCSFGSRDHFIGCSYRTDIQMLVEDYSGNIFNNTTTGAIFSTRFKSKSSTRTNYSLYRLDYEGYSSEHGKLWWRSLFETTPTQLERACKTK